MSINIDTTDPNYILWHGRFITFRDSVQPRLNLYFKMTQEQQERWLAKDEMMQDIIQWCDRVSREKNDDA